ncbi:MAG: hypothetical protein PHW18_13225 [Sulfuricurvum sp.]|uniref:hypothetical protein n=1 Tax=Sulfuricurvum sp. TaxID=2025608 RepID=UPI002625ECA1|nr:hypothetical protein [Sulfuricurvum sp.]MDD2830530.1 hypothetical protein [Sulfuricurvum sp.]MDD4948880.1 hypothetical protein [Sulfuricurvum sp.]
MSERKIFATLLGVNLLILLAQIQGLSISYSEAKIVYGDFSLIKSLVTFFLNSFGYNDYALRLPMIFIHLYSAILLYLISGYYVSRKYDRAWIMAIYLLLPGVTSAALLVNVAGLKIAIIFTFVYLYLRYANWSLIVLPFFLFLDSTSIYFFLSLVLYAFIRKNYLLILFSSLLFIASIIYFDPAIGGVPKGHFLDALGIYAAIFSPLVFIYLFYVLYRRFIANERDLLWVIASSMFIVSLLLSFRQKVNIQDFAPYVMVALPLAAQTFLHTYRIRLSMFRRRYRLLFYTAFTLLVLNALAVLLNHWFYQWIKKPQDHFSYTMHVAKDLAKALKEENIACVTTNEKMQLRLRFYGIGECRSTLLSNNKEYGSNKVTISYTNIPIYTIYVTKVNK